MSVPASTCWKIVEGAAAGRATDREAFAGTYLPVLRAYLHARWQNSPLRAEVEDAVQEVFLDCFKPGGALARVDPEREGGFRVYLYGIARNVAQRVERREARRRARPGEKAFDGGELQAEDPGPSSVFELAWATAILKRAAEQQSLRAARSGPAASRRVEILRLKFEEGLPIREIALRFGEDAARVHHEYATARNEFRAALLEVVEFHHPGARREVLEAECARILAAFK